MKNAALIHHRVGQIIFRLKGPYTFGEKEYMSSGSACECAPFTFLLQVLAADKHILKSQVQKNKKAGSKFT